MTFRTEEQPKVAGETLGNRLRVARAERDISQAELAKLVGVTRQTVSAIETELYCPSTLLAFQLARELGKGVEELFFLKNESLPKETQV